MCCNFMNWPVHWRKEMCRNSTKSYNGTNRFSLNAAFIWLLKNWKPLPIATYSSGSANLPFSRCSNWVKFWCANRFYIFQVWLITQSHQLDLNHFLVALQFVGESEITMDETHCIVANLIYEGRIKGYISHQHNKLVVSKQNPFPALNMVTWFRSHNYYCIME